MQTKNFLKLSILDISGIIASREDATMIVMPGADGEIGVMPLHIPIIIELKPGNISIYQEEKIISVITLETTAIAKVYQDVVSIIIDN